MLVDKYKAYREKGKEVGNEYFKKAIIELEKTIECDPEYAKAYTYLSICHQNLGDTTKANSYKVQGDRLEQLKSKNQQVKMK